MSTSALFKRRLIGCWGVLLLGAISAHAQSPGENLIQNSTFSAAKPLDGWRVDFPYEGWYVKNAGYVKPDKQQGKTCIVIDLPPGVAGNEGGKIESAFIKAEPGATYKVEIDAMTNDFSGKLFAEAWTKDPKPIDKPDKFRVPITAHDPPLIMCYRAQMPDPPAAGKAWSTSSREFTLPKTVRVAGQEEQPVYLSLKAYTYQGTMKGGKAYFTNFRLYKVKSATDTAAH